MHKTSRSFMLLVLLNAFSLLAVGTPRVWSSGSNSITSRLMRSSVSLPQGSEVTKANWRQHPKIKEVRAIVQSVNTGMSGKAFTVKRRAFEYCEPYEDTARMIATDSKGRVRFYRNEGGSEDSSLKWEHYYDEAGRLRFVFITGGATNGSQLEHRIYFDQNGKRLWEEQTYTKGPGYTFPKVWPDDQLQLADAATKFSSKSACPEINAKSKR